MNKRKAMANGVLTKEQFKKEVETWVKTIGSAPTVVHVRPMTRKWGSCSTSGRVTFDTELMSQPAEFRKEVIVHELLHLKVPNHGKVFRSLLRAYLGKTIIVTLNKRQPTGMK